MSQQCYFFLLKASLSRSLLLTPAICGAAQQLALINSFHQTVKVEMVLWVQSVLQTHIQILNGCAINVPSLTRKM